MKALWVLVLLCAGGSGLVGLAVVVLSKGAPQEAAGAALACAGAVVPYVMARAVEGLGGKDSDD